MGLMVIYHGLMAEMAWNNGIKEGKLQKYYYDSDEGL